MNQERISTYLQSLERPLPAYLEEIEEQAQAEFVPIIRKEAESLLMVLLEMKKPKKILEVGTAVGFSTLLMREFAPEAQITTIEYFPPRIEAAQAHFDQFDTDGRITLLAGDAGKIIPEMDDRFDLIFLDSAKGQYPVLLPELIRMMNPGAVLLTDNVLQEGELLESHFIVKQRDRTIHARMREYLYELKHRDDLVTTILPIGDGMAVSVKR